MANEQLISEIVSPKANEQVNKLTADLVKANAEMQDTIQAAHLLNQTLANGRGLTNYNQTVTQSAIAQERLTQAQLRTQAAQLRLTQAQERATRQTQAQTRRTAEMSREYVQLDNRHKSLVKRAQDLGVQFGVNSRQFRAATSEANKLDKQLKKIDEALGKRQRNVGNYANGFKSALSEMAAFATGGLSIGSALKYVFDSTRELSGIRTSLAFILNSDGAAANKLEELKVQANLTGQEFFTLAKTYKSFIGAAIASNFPLEQAEKVFKSVTVAAGRLGLSSEQTEGALLALQQMISKGNVQAEELRGQLGERLPGAFSLAAKAMGVTEKELNKLLQTGQVTAAEMLPKLATQLDKTFGLKAGEEIGGLNAEIGRLMTQLQVFAGESSSLSKNIFEPIIRGARELIKELNNYTRGSGILENLDFFTTFSQKKRKNQLTAYDLRDSLANSNNQISSFPSSYEGKNIKELDTENSIIAKGYTAAINAYNKFSNGIKKGDLEDRGGELNKYAAAVNLFAEQIKKVNAARRTAPKSSISSVETPDDQLTAIKEIQKRISELSAMPGSAIQGSTIDIRIDKLKARLKGLTRSVKDYSDQVRKSAAGAIQALIEQNKDALNYYEEGMNNENFSLDARLEQLKNYTDIRLANAALEGRKEIEGKKLTDNEIIAINEETQRKQNEIRQEQGDKALFITRQNLKRIKDAIAEQAEKDLTDLERQRDEELKILTDSYTSGNISLETFTFRKQQIERAYTDKYIAMQIEQTKAFIEQSKLRGENTEEAEAKLAEIRLKYSNLRVNDNENENEETLEKDKERAEAVKQIINELYEFGKALGSATFTRRINEIEREKTALTERTALEISNVEASTATEQEKADRIAIINARSASDQAVLDEKIKQQKIKQAKFDKAAAIAQIIIQTALAQIKVIGQSGLIGFTFSPLITALGAISLASAIATPIPEYKHGKSKNNNYEGMAVVGDGGMSELIIDPNGRMSVTPNKPTLTHVGRDTQVISGPDFKRMLAKPNAVQSVGGVSVDMSELVYEQRQTRKAIGKQSVNALIVTEKGNMKKNVRTYEYNKYTSRHFRNG